MRTGRWAVGAVALALAHGAVTVSPARAADRRETDAARQLLAFVPTEIRPSCRIVDLQQSLDAEPLVRYAHDITVAVQCVPPAGADAVTYVQAESAQRANRLYRAFAPKRRLTRTNRAASCEGAETYSLGNGKPTVGHDVCYFETNVFVGDAHPVAIDWTYAPRAIYVQSYRSDGDAQALRDWWSDIAGPLQDPQNARIPAPQTAGEGAASYRALLHHLPEAVRSTCRRASLQDDAPPSVADARVWVDAAADCHDDATGIDASFLHFTWNAPLDSEYRRMSEPLGGGQASPAPGSSGCPTSGTWQYDGTDVGPFACGSVAADSGAGSASVLAYAWADPVDRIFAFAARAGSDGSELRAWWLRAGPMPA